ncbi:putative Histidine kinase [Magnetospirillum gryphiswaldense MSR-1 v2]|uniref:histidine kinase n=2 Tax=Magnetospirillum gryphiswaldense TaxID=55518 RepID=V6F338_MAGGM|nr:putative Histidine kinase [Magnetospirillum gryphiswaldense MSR-1 v2]
MRSVPLSDIMTRAVVTIVPDSPVAAALAIMGERRISCLVVAEGRRPIGILTERDLVRRYGGVALADGEQEVRSIMTPSPVTVPPDIDQFAAFKMMKTGRFRHLVVVDDGGDLLGIVTETDFVHHLGVDFYLRPKDVLSVMAPAVTVDSDCPLADAIARLARRDTFCVIVTQDGKAAGILTERDIVRLLCLPQGDGSAPTASQVMSAPLRSIPAEASLLEAAATLRQAKLRHLVVLDDDGQAIGVVGEHEIVKGLESGYVVHLERIIAERNAALAALAEANAALHASAREARFAMLVTERMADATVWISPDGRHLYSNRAWSELSGFSAEETRKKFVWDFTPNFLREDWLAHWQALRSQGTLAFEAVLINRDGASIPCEVVANHIVFEGEEYNVGIIRDLRDRRILEQELRARVDDLRLAQQVARIGSWRLNAETGQLSWSDETHRMFGVAPGTPLTYELFLASVHPDDRAMIDQAWNNAQAGAPYDIVHRIVTGGDVRWVHEQASLEFDGDGRLLGGIGTVQDVTDQRLLLDARHASEERLRLVLEVTADGIWDWDLVADRAELNDRYYELLGYARGEFEPGRASLPRLFHPDDLPGILDTLAANIDGSVSSYDNEVRMVTKAGEVKWVHVRGRIVERDATGRGTRMVGSVTDITARKVLERGMREREAFYRAAIETTADGFWLCDLDGRILEVNSAYAEMSGYTVDELCRMSIADLDAEETASDVRTQLATIIAGGGAVFERRHRRKDGSLWDVEVCTLFSDIEDGRCFAFLRDLAIRRRAEALLKARLRLSDIGRGGNIDALMTEVLDTAERLTASAIGFFHFVDDDQSGLTLQAWSTNTLANICRAEAKGQHYAVTEAGIWADCLRQGRAIICNDYAALPTKHCLPDGHAPVTRLLSVPVPGETGFQAVIGVGNKSADYDADDLAIVAELAGIAMDVVNWVRAEGRLRESEFFLRETQRVGKLGGWKANPETGMLMWTDEVYAMVEEPLPSRPELAAGIDYYLPQYREPLRQTLRRAFDRREPFQMELELLSRTGRHRWVELRGAPNATESKPDYLVGTILDISERKEAEARLLRTIDELTRSNSELERFAYVASHDLQEPLRNVVAFCQLLERQMQGRIEAEERETLEIIVGGARRMRDLVHDLLEYSCAGHFEAERELVKLPDLVAVATANLQSAIAESGAEVECDADVEMSVVELPMMQVFQNLISNAIKFRDPLRPLRVRIHGERVVGGIQVSVIDNGIGIEPSYLDQVFVIFKRLHRPSDIPGTGLGLAICRRIVENHGGRIWAASEGARKGTTIHFVLPADGSAV